MSSGTTISTEVPVSYGWFSYYRENFKRIATLTKINLILTLTTDLVSRGILSFFTNDNQIFSEGIPINGQVLVNLIMTFIVSNIGGIILFVNGRKQRFLAFLAIGVFASFLSQVLSKLILPYTQVGFDRLAFDLLYTATFKFIFFEYFREKLIFPTSKFVTLFRLRFKADLIMAGIKNYFLWSIGLRQ